MKLTAIQTINNRPLEVMQMVADSFKRPGNKPDEMVIVLDRVSDETRKNAERAYSGMGFYVRFAEVRGEPGWRGPARAWNRGFESTKGDDPDIFYCFSSEVVQDEENIDNARRWMENAAATGTPHALFGACHNSIEKPLVVGAPPGLLASTQVPRPLGFIVAMPANKVYEIGGYDEEFMKGLCYEDDDFFLRLWQAGVDFVFDDRIHGIHLDHDRPGLVSAQGQKDTETNQRYFMKKHALEDLERRWVNVQRNEMRTKDYRIWRHP